MSMKCALRLLRLTSLSRSNGVTDSRGLSSIVIEETTETVRTEPSKEELENEEPWMQKEIVGYYKGRTVLAKLMGQKPESFTEKDVQDAVRYLLPSSLTAKDARPFLKHPSEIFPKRREAAFDTTGRPLEPAFYTGFPAYHNLIYDIYESKMLLECSVDHSKQVLQSGSSPRSSSGPHSGSEVESQSDSVLTESHSDTLDTNKAQSDSVLTESHSDTLDTTKTQSDSTSNNEFSDTVQTDSVQNVLSSRAAPLEWFKKSTMSNVLAEELSDERYEDLITRLSELASHPNSSVVSSLLDKYRRPNFVYRSQANLPKINKDGYSYAVGKRKTSVARVWLKKGIGLITVNGRNFVEYFPKVEDRQQVLYPLLLINQLGKWDIETKIEGGGSTGQAGALRHGISKALLAFQGDHCDKLERAGLLIRDPRMVERKKPGQKKARKKFAWVKR